jgi:hypothetical protein
MDYCLCYNKPVCFRRSRSEAREFKTSRAAVLSLKMLKARNLEIDLKQFHPDRTVDDGEVGELD